MDVNDAPFHLALLDRVLAGLPNGVRGLCNACIISISSSSTGKGTSGGIPNFLSHGSDRWSHHLLPGGRPEKRTDTSPATRTSFFLADVRTSLLPAFQSLSPHRP